jgi:hypothetical protein
MSVIYLSDTEYGFEGELKGSGVKKPKEMEHLLPIDISFSSTVRADGSIDMAIIFNTDSKILRAYVDNEGDIMRMRSESFNGGLVDFDEADRERLKELARAIKARYKADRPVTERFGTFANYLIQMAPSGAPVDLRFIKKGKTKCWAFSRVVVAALGTDFREFVEKVRSGRLDAWLKARNWTYEKDEDAICGLKETGICDRIGEIFKDRAGWVTTLPLNNRKNITEVPHQTKYFHNTIPVGIIKRIRGPLNEFCLGRCGPGCGDVSDEYFNSSNFTCTAECFAHDACIGEVGYKTAIPTGGIGNACMDEFIAASWGYNNGKLCKGGNRADLLGWWGIKTENRFVQLSKNGKLKTMVDDKYQDAGEWTLNQNRSDEQHVEIRRVWKLGIPERIYTGKVEEGIPLEISGLSTSDNEAAKAFTAIKANINGVVEDSGSYAALPGVKVQLLGKKWDKTPKTVETNEKGGFIFLQVHPYEKYTVTLSKEGYEELKAKALVFTGGNTITYQLKKKPAIFKCEEDVTFYPGICGAAIKAKWTLEVNARSPGIVTSGGDCWGYMMGLTTDRCPIAMNIHFSVVPEVTSGSCREWEDGLGYHDHEWKIVNTRCTNSSGEVVPCDSEWKPDCIGGAQQIAVGLYYDMEYYRDGSLWHTEKKGISGYTLFVTLPYASGLGNTQSLPDRMETLLHSNAQ